MFRVKHSGLTGIGAERLVGDINQNRVNPFDYEKNEGSQAAIKQTRAGERNPARTWLNNTKEKPGKIEQLVDFSQKSALGL